ncbi:MAG: glycosyltransferase family 2 protein [Candidatus Micrarchaeia archaeon]
MPVNFKDVSVILPTIEEEGVFSLVKELRRLMPESEIIIVDKSSPEYRKRLESTGAKIIYQESKGVEAATMEGFIAANGSILANLDADGTYSPEDLIKAINYLHEKHLDMVLGNRFHENTDSKAIRGYLSFGNKSINRIYKTMHGIDIHDGLTGIFVMTKKAFEAMKDAEPYRAGSLFFVLEIEKKGFTKIAEIPISYGLRPSGTKSKLAKSKLLYGLGVAGHIVRTARDYSPLLIFGSIGAILILAGLVLGAFVIASYIRTGLLTEVGRALISFMLVIIGFLSIISGLLLDLLLQIAKKMDKL